MADPSLLLSRIADFLRSRQNAIAKDVVAELGSAAEAEAAKRLPWSEHVEEIISAAATALTNKSGSPASSAGPRLRASGGTKHDVQSALTEAWQVRSLFLRVLNRFQAEQSGRSGEFNAMDMSGARQEAVQELDRQIATRLARWLDETGDRSGVPVSTVRDLHAGMRAIQGLLQLALEHMPPQSRGHISAAVQQLGRLASGALELIEKDPLSEQVGNSIGTAPPPAAKSSGPLAMTPMDVGTFVHSLAESARPLAQKKGVRVTAMCNPGPAILKTDAERLLRAATLLVDYAVSFTEEGEVSILSGAGEKGFWMLEVRDTSAGVPPEILAKLMQGTSFASDEPSAVSDAALGVALARDLVQLLGGSLTATSEPGEGNSFELIIPIA